ncbi:tetratricopeptide repeat protein [Falsiroseomonas sp. CW058]|uniref:tetratricopeptide repeat protein n=1 Tax=Falsiroseomonas sp. CW058 TaxID=3388664 RepID=UPI003D31AFCF
MDVTPPSAMPDIAPPSPGLLRRAWGLGLAGWRTANHLAVTLVPLLCGGIAVAIVLQEAARQPIDVVPLSVPSALSDTGMTGDVIAHRLLDAIEATARAVHGETMSRPAAELDGTQPDLNIPVAGISLRSVASVVRSLLGWPERRLSGEIVTAGDTLRLRLRLAGHGVIADVEGPAAQGADPLLARAAPEVWRIVAPRLYAWHVAQSGLAPQELRDRLALLRRRATDAETEPTIVYLTAQSLVASGRAAEALGMLDALVAARPGYAAGHYGRAQALRALGRGPEALEAQQRGLALDPGSAWAHLASATLLRDLGRPADALAAARRAQDLDEDDRPGLVEEAAALRALARLEEAAAAARRAIALDPDYPPALAELGHVVLQQRDHAGALSLFEGALRRAPRMATAQTGRGEALAALGRMEEALEALALAVALDEADHRPHGLRGEVLHGLQQWAGALEAFEAAILLAPDRAALHLGRGVAALRLDRPLVALEALRRAQALGLDDADLRALLDQAQALAR